MKRIGAPIIVGITSGILSSTFGNVLLGVFSTHNWVFFIIRLLPSIFFSFAIIILLELEGYVLYKRRSVFFLINILGYCVFVYSVNILSRSNFVPDWFSYVVAGMAGTVVLSYALKYLLHDISTRLHFLSFVIVGSLLPLGYMIDNRPLLFGVNWGILIWQTGMLLLIYKMTHIETTPVNSNIFKNKHVIVWCVLLLVSIFVQIIVDVNYFKSYSFSEIIGRQETVFLPETTEWKNYLLWTIGGYISLDYPANWKVDEPTTIYDNKDEVTFSLPEQSGYSLLYITVSVRPIQENIDINTYTNQIIAEESSYYHYNGQINIENISIGGEPARVFYWVDWRKEKSHFVYVTIHNGYRYVIKDFPKPKEGYYEDGGNIHHVFPKGYITEGYTPEVFHMIQTLRFVSDEEANQN